MMNKTVKRLIPFLLLGGAASLVLGCGDLPPDGEAADSDEPLESISSPIWNGTPVDSKITIEIHSSAGGCSAVMVNPAVALTSAHCTTTASTQSFKVYRSQAGGARQLVGTYNAGVTRDAFYSGSGDAGDDGAVLRFPNPIPQVVTVPIYTGTLGNEVLFAMGWGYDTYSNPTTVDVLKYGPLVVSRRMTEYLVAYANHGQIRSCHGDSGGPWLKVTSSGFAVAAIDSNSDKNGGECAAYKAREEAFRLRGSNADWVERAVNASAFATCRRSGDILDCQGS